MILWNSVSALFIIYFEKQNISDGYDNTGVVITRQSPVKHYNIQGSDSSRFRHASAVSSD